MNLSELSDIEHVRARASMYIGSRDFFGLIHYLVYAVNSFLERGPTELSLTCTAGTFSIEADIDWAIEENETGDLLPLECFRKRRGTYEPVVTALSQNLMVEAISGGRHWEVAYHRGQRTSMTTNPNEGAAHTRLTFSPDLSIFTIESISLYNFHSYLNRMSYLHPGVRFVLTVDDERTEYFSLSGIRDMFQSISAPYQLLHEPVHLRETAGDLEFEFIFAFQSWTGDFCWSFVNKGRAVEGGTHEEGLSLGLAALRDSLKQADERAYQNGIVGIMSLTYPNVRFEGCIKARVGAPELTAMVEKLVLDGSLKWLEEHPEVRGQLTDMCTFQFPEVWRS